jgi:pSer/pThr/pTyr-binding forkhead associated (FHA) protein
MAKLVILNGEQEGFSTILLSGSSITVGRSVECDLTLKDPRCSRKHCCISSKRDGTITIEDLKSRHGIFVNDRQISGKQTIKSGTEFMIGQTFIRLYDDHETHDSDEDVSQFNQKAQEIASRQQKKADRLMKMEKEKKQKQKQTARQPAKRKSLAEKKAQQKKLKMSIALALFLPAIALGFIPAFGFLGKLFGLVLVLSAVGLMKSARAQD